MREKAKIMWLASSGGHMEELMMLSSTIKKYDSVLFTEKKGNSQNCFRKIYIVDQVNRRQKFFWLKFLKLFLKSFKLFLIERPDAVVSTGALVTVPMAIIAKVFGKKLIYIESFARVTEQSLTGKIMYKFADVFIIQWEELRKFYPDAMFLGGIF